MKKTIAILLSLLLAVNCCAFAVEEGKSVEEPIQGQVIPTLEGLGLIQPEYDVSALMTRAEFAVLIAALNGLDTFSGSGKGTVYIDVPEEYWAAPAIEAVTAQGLMKGMDTGIFGPEEKITLEQAAKVYVDSLGYGFQITGTDAYPTGYTAMAVSLGLLKHIPSQGYGIPADKGQIAQLIYNGLNVPMWVAVGFGNDITMEKRGTLLKEKRNIGIYEGLLVRNSFSGLSDADGLGTGKLALRTNQGNELIFAGDGTYDNLLGYRVTLYADETVEEPTVLFAIRERNTELIIKAEQFIRCSGTELIYYSDTQTKEKELKAKLLRGADYLYNGAAADFDWANLSVENGEIRLLDSDLNGVYDIILVNEYQNLVFAKYLEKDRLISDRFSRTHNVTYDPLDENMSFQLRDESGSIAISSLQEWDVLCVYQSVNASGRKRIQAVKGGEAVTGTIDSIQEDSVTISGKEYKISEYYRQNAGKIGSLEIGVEKTFLIDCFGKLVAMTDEQEQLYTFGYLIGMTEISDMEKTRIKLCDQFGDIVTYELADRLTIDKVSGKSSSALRDTLLSLGTDGTMAQVIRFRINKDNEISHIDTAQADETPSTDELREDIRNQELNYRKDSKSFEGLLMLTEESIILNVPEDLSQENRYAFLNAASMPDSIYRISAYNISDTGEAAFIVIRGDTAANIDIDSEWSVVQRKVTAMDSEGNIAEKLYLYGSSSGERSFYVDEKTVFCNFYLSAGKPMTWEELASGDIVRIASNANTGYLQQVERFFSFKELETGVGEVDHNGNALGTYSAIIRRVVAKPLTLSGELAKVQIHNSVGNEEKQVFWNFKNARLVTVTEKSDGTLYVEKGSINDIKDAETAGMEKASYIVIKSRYGVVKEAFIYRLQEE